MGHGNESQPKWYVLTYVNSHKRRKIVYGWEAVLKERGRSKTYVRAKGFHTKEAAELHVQGIRVGTRPA